MIIVTISHNNPIPNRQLSRDLRDIHIKSTRPCNDYNILLIQIIGEKTQPDIKQAKLGLKAGR